MQLKITIKAVFELLVMLSALFVLSLDYARIMLYLNSLLYAIKKLLVKKINMTNNFNRKKKGSI